MSLRPGKLLLLLLIPVLLYGKPVRSGSNIGVRASFADLAATIADELQVGPPPQGSSFSHLIGAV